MTDGTSLHAFDADGCGAPTCTPLWTVTPGGEGSRLSLGAATDDGHVVVTHAYTEVDRFGRRTHRERILFYDSAGAPAWATTPSGPMMPNTIHGEAVAGDVVYATESQDSGGPEPGTYSLRAYATSTGTLLWSADLGPFGPSSAQVIVGGGVVYVGVGNEVLAFRRAGCGASTCTPLVSLPLPGMAATMTVAQGHLLATSITLSGDTALTAFVPG